MVPTSYIFCYWIWLWTILYAVNIIKQSPLPASIGALIFTTWNVFLSPWSKKFKLDFSIFIVSLEILVVALVAYKLNIILILIIFIFLVCISHEY